ncbi:MAG: hypothetical protein ABL895_11855 [Cyclobacteriaceae bacterium]
MLSMAVARLWPAVFSNAVDPGWVPTWMGGKSAPDNLQKGYETQVWLAVSEDEKAKVSGKYFYHQKERPANPIATDVDLQDKFLELLSDLTGFLLLSNRLLFFSCCQVFTLISIRIYLN